MIVVWFGIVFSLNHDIKFHASELTPLETHTFLPKESSWSRASWMAGSVGIKSRSFRTRRVILKFFKFEIFSDKSQFQ